MAAYSAGVNDPLAVKLWSRKLMREALAQTFMSKYMGESSSSAIQIQNDTKKSAGDRITIGLRMQLSGAGVQGDGTLEGLEEALQTYSDNIFINQLRHAVRSGGKMSEQRVPFSVREEARTGLQDWWSDRMDQSIINQLTGNTGQTDTRYTGNQATIAPVYSSTAASNRWVFSGASTTEASLSTTEIMSLAVIDKCVTTAKTSVPLMRPIMVDGKEMYVLMLHPHQIYSLRTNTNTGQWLDIQMAAMTGGKVSDNPIFTGAMGVYNNVVIVETRRIPTVVANTRRGVFFGAQACGFAVGQDSAPEKMTWVEELFDYENQLGVSAGMIFGAKKIVYNSLDFGTLAVSTYATAP